MAFNIGGCLADSSWLEAGDVPMVSFHCAKDENGPYANGDVIVPTTGNFVVEAQGSYIVQKHQDMYANNAPFANAGFTDPITVQSVINNTTYSTINNYTVGNNYEGLYTFVTPGPSTTPNPFGQAYTEEGAPWDWWDNTTYGIQAEAVNGVPGMTSPAFFEANALLGNPDMSALKGNLYIDTIQGYLNPRMHLVLDLANTNYVLGIYGCTDVLACNYNINANSDNGSCDLPNGCGDPLYVEYDASVTCSDPNACITLIATGINEVIDASTEIYPNPANNSLNIVSYAAGINTIAIYNLNGQQVLNTEVNANQIRLNTSNLAKGVYIIDIKSNDASVKRKLIIE